MANELKDKMVPSNTKELWEELRSLVEQFQKVAETSPDPPAERSRLRYAEDRCLCAYEAANAGDTTEEYLELRDAIRHVRGLLQKA